MSLRTKLFLSVGCILLIVAILSYLLPEIWIKKDIDKASAYVTSELKEAEEKVFATTSFLISFRLLQSVAELEGASDMLADAPRFPNAKEESNWVIAAKIATYNPDIAFVQISNGQTAIVIPEDGNLYNPLWALFEKQMLWVKIPEQKDIFIAIPAQSNGNYLLFNINKTESNAYGSKFQEALDYAKAHKEQSLTASFTKPKDTISQQTKNKMLYQSVLQSEKDWIKKVDLIRLLAPFQEKIHPDGYFQIDKSNQEGFAILAKEVFSSDKLEQISKEKPQILVRNSQRERILNVAQSFSISSQTVALGFSFSSIIKKIATVLKKPILIYWDGDLILGFSKTGEEINLHELHFIHDEMVYLGESYIPHKVDLDQNFSLRILISQAQRNNLIKFLNGLKEKLIAKVSLNLIGASILCFGIALLLLGRISKKITKPIALLARASQEIGAGKYENLKLPKVEKRQDEVGVLVHSFENMVLSLKEREKIRSVLNKVVSKEIATEILKGNIELKGEERTLTMLFSDIRGFTRLSEHVKPRILIGMLNDYMTRMCRIIDATHGVVDKFVGDEIMSLYGAPIYFEDHAVKAIEAAILMMQSLKEWNQIQPEKGFEIGIGIHTGLAYAGSMGAENRLNYTVVGANVNLASRICSFAAPKQILISENTLKEPGVKERFAFKKLEPVALKGIDHPVTLYELNLSLTSS